LIFRYDSEKDELLARLNGSDKRFMSEKDRQAELLRLKREQRRAQQEEKFGAAALVFGLAERNQNAAQERYLKSIALKPKSLLYSWVTDRSRVRKGPPLLYRI